MSWLVSTVLSDWFSRRSAPEPRYQGPMTPAALELAEVQIPVKLAEAKPVEKA